VPGLGVYKLVSGDSDWTLKDVISQIEYIRSSKTNGIAFFRGTQLFKNVKGVYSALKDKYFKYPALLPPLTWLSNKRPNAPIDVNVIREGDRLRISWRMPDGTDDPGSLRYTVYYSRSNSVNTTLSQNILTTGLLDSEIYLAVGMEKEEELSFRISASNRYHIESRPSHEVYYYLSAYEK
jgi:hypothetical protein